MVKSVVLRQVEGKPGQVWYPLDLKTTPEQPPKDGQVVIKMTGAALNHRDLFMRQHLYPGISFGVPMLADGVGIVVQTGKGAERWKGKRVVINPGSGWKDDPDGPESLTGYAILGGTKMNPIGTLTDTVTIDAGELEEAPPHLSSAEAAALPLAGLTAWRATVTKSGNALPGRNILVTGVGGGVALMAVLFAVGKGANVYVTSGSEEKLEKAKKLGAKGGVNYKSKDWEKQLQAMLPKERRTFDAIIDGAGGDIVPKSMRLLKSGGVISSYGMTIGPKMPFLMGAVMRNLEIRGSTMGSRKEFAEMVAFVKEKKLTPVVSRVVQGLDNLKDIDTLFEDMKNGSQFGKLCIEIAKDEAVAKL